MRSIPTLALLALSVGCATLTPEGARVRVYEADLSVPRASRALPPGCRLVAPAAEPIDQMESERQTSDPYRLQRNAAAENGANVLLVLSKPILARPKLDCSVGDNSPECVSRGENWYRVAFEGYACDESALNTLASLPPAMDGSGANLWPFGKKTKPTPAAAPAPASSATSAPAASSVPAPGPTPALDASGTSPDELERKVLSLMKEGLGTDVIVAYVRGQRLTTGLRPEEIVEWKKAGISERVIEAAIDSASR